jgi:hypothetical protein
VCNSYFKNSCSTCQTRPEPDFIGCNTRASTLCYIASKSALKSERDKRTGKSENKAMGCMITAERFRQLGFGTIYPFAFDSADLSKTAFDENQCRLQFDRRQLSTKSCSPENNTPTIYVQLLPSCGKSPTALKPQIDSIERGDSPTVDQ